MIIKGILTDLGNTIIYNRKINFEKGFMKMYQLSLKNISIEEYMSVAKRLKKEFYTRRKEDDVEVKLYQLLSIIDEKSGLITNANYLDLEKEFLFAGVIDEAVENIEEFLQFVNSKRIPIFIVSNSTFQSDTLKEELIKMDLFKYFSGILSSADIAIRKPSKGIFLEGIKNMKQLVKDIDVKEMVYIGNDYNIDMIGANNASIRGLWFNKEGLTDQNQICEYVFNDYKELIKYIKILNSKIN